MATRAGASGDLDTAVLLRVLGAFQAGDLSARMPEGGTGVAGKIADALNEVVARNQRSSAEPAPPTASPSRWTSAGCSTS